MKNRCFCSQICKHIVVKDLKTTVLDLRWQEKRRNTLENHWEDLFTWRLFCIYLFYKKVLWNWITELQILWSCWDVPMVFCAFLDHCMLFVCGQVVLKHFVFWSDGFFVVLKVASFSKTYCEATDLWIVFRTFYKEFVWVCLSMICLRYPLMSCAVLTITKYTQKGFLFKINWFLSCICQ